MTPLDIPRPKGWRKGQLIFDFLEWLGAHKGYAAGENKRMADPFHIPDEEMDELWAEYTKTWI